MLHATWICAAKFYARRCIPLAVHNIFETARYTLDLAGAQQSASDNLSSVWNGIRMNERWRPGADSYGRSRNSNEMLFKSARATRQIYECLFRCAIKWRIVFFVCMNVNTISIYYLIFSQQRPAVSSRPFVRKSDRHSYSFSSPH